MGVPNTALKRFLTENNPGLTKEAVDKAVHEIETNFVAASQAAGIGPEDLLKVAQESPEQWNTMVNNYVNDLVAASAEQQTKEAQQKQAEADYMAKVAEDTVTGQRIAHACWDELCKISAAFYAKMAEEESPSEEKKDEEKKDEKKDEEKKDEKKDDKGVPPALQAFMNKEKGPEGEKEAAAREAVLRTEAEATYSAIMMKAASLQELRPEEKAYLANYKMAQAGLLPFASLVGQG